MFLNGIVEIKTLFWFSTFWKGPVYKNRPKITNKLRSVKTRSGPHAVNGILVSSAKMSQKYWDKKPVRPPPLLREGSSNSTWLSWLHFQKPSLFKKCTLLSSRGCSLSFRCKWISEFWSDAALLCWGFLLCCGRELLRSQKVCAEIDNRT